MKKFVIALDFRQALFYYARFNFALRTIDEIYNPHFATSFDTETEALGYIKEYSDLLEYVKIIPQEEAKLKWDNWMAEGSIRRSFKYIEHADSYPYDKTKHSKEDILNFWFNKWSKPIKSEHYKTWPNLYEVYKNLWTVGRYRDIIDSVDDSDLRISVELVVRPDSTLAEFKEEFSKIVDKCTLIDHEGYKVFPIFDHELSQYQSYYFHYKSDDYCSIDTQLSTQCTGNIEQVFAYWKRHHFY